MSADLLRRAATTMRKQAEAATPGPWRARDLHSTYGRPNVRAVNMAGAMVQGITYDIGRGNAAHIASWHPAVALAVADWLEDQARYWDAVDAAPAYVEGDPASAVARAYLGES